ncbi:RNA-binding transcriptional accessory protein [Oleiphilus sp. HI0009]|uniref:Tex family protein n=3 Tax=Oleiphilus sp. HI0125 TaxID=1822266 RepID=UPI0007C395F1|nr:Tex family protein [Oleiphilus sp. HI0125]KZX76831.1 RNA-binding transcriptional accessory protein [Oleiphilus sp. HI0009]KZZ58343.1 RNA-binding transcriptional accessory protein [Oleiphilus sp. HI0125]
MLSITQTIANELSVRTEQVDATIRLIKDGATIPFIARYRKEQTGALDDTQLRKLDERLTYLTELNERREVILNSISEQDKLTPELEKKIQSAQSKQTLEDLYLPYKPKRRTKGQIAIEAGLEPLADRLFSTPEISPEHEAEKYINETLGCTNVKAVLDGAKYILIERFCEDADLLNKLRNEMWQYWQLESSVADEKHQDAQKFRDYFEYNESIKKIPSHRALALFRGRKDGILSLKLEHQDADKTSRISVSPCEIMIAEHFAIKDQGRASDAWLREVVRWAWRVKLSMSIETELLSQLRETAESGAIKVFADNLKDLLLAAPAGPKVTIGLDPGLRTGVKVAVVDATGKLLAYDTIYPHAPKNQWDTSRERIAQLAKKYNAELLSIGNGTASRETEKLCADVCKYYPDLKLSRIVVSEAGASVYSASEIAANEFPDIDVSIRGAVSIARRLQDPLAELVKIEPKAIGVGQYQHDVSQFKLGKSLDAVIEDCVNAVGVDVNTASAPLLSRVSGIAANTAFNIVLFRDTYGAFRSREDLKSVPRLGDKTFEQCAGFLRINNGENPLDASAVHPESYSVVEQIAKSQDKKVVQLIGETSVTQLDASAFTSDSIGVHTINDILRELAKPGRDPRPEFKSASFKEGIEEISDLKEGMILEGSVTNVTNFGAFVDIGVHQDGLVHISCLANKFVKDPRDVVKTGDIVKVKVLEFDAKRKRVALSMRLQDAAEQTTPKSSEQKNTKAKNQQNAPLNNAFASAFAKAKKQ